MVINYYHYYFFITHNNNNNNTGGVNLYVWNCVDDITECVCVCVCAPVMGNEEHFVQAPIYIYIHILCMYLYI